MTEEKRIYDFGNYVTASEELAEIFFCLKKMASVLEFSDDETVDALVEKQMAVSGYASRMKSSLSDFLERAYHAELDQVAQGSFAAKIAENLNEMKKKTFYFREIALQLPADQIKANLREAARLAGGLPSMVAALDAGEDEVK
ncbi:MAG: hypothetical protein IJ752_07800 [Alphaproteobacteria bacterium]|nr:hypothetical protein [Alphaproteobacteria bacterium]